MFRRGEAYSCRRQRHLIELLEPRYLLSEYFLSPAGSDLDDGSLDSPWRTLSHALEIVQPHDVITLRAGAYEGNVWISTPNLTLRSYEGEMATIWAPINDPQIEVTIRVDIDAHNTHLIGLEIVGGYYYALKTESSWGWGVPNEHGPSGLIVQDCKIHDTGADAIKLTPGTNNGIIVRTEIYNSGRIDPTNCEGIDAVQANNFIVADCYIHDIPTNGIYFKGGSTGTIIERNVVHRTGHSGILLGQDTDLEWFDTTVNPNYFESIDGIVRNNVVLDADGAGIGAWAALRPQIYNNTLHNVARLYFGGLLITAQEHYTPELTYTPSTNVTIYNNIVHVASNRPALEIRENGLAGSLNISHNIYYNSTRPVVIRDITRGFEGSLAQWQYLGFDAFSMEVNPQLDLANELTLMITSPAIDAGKPAPVLNDHWNNPRPTGDAFDIGAHEFPLNLLSAPTELSASEMVPGEVTLTWVNNQPGASIHIDISTSADFSRDLQRITLPPDTTTYAWGGLLANVPYHFRIRATDWQFFSNWIAASVTTAPIGPIPLTPSSPAVVLSAAGQVEISWTAPPAGDGNQPTGYLLERSTSPDFAENYLGRAFDASVLGFLDTEVEPHTVYYYRVIATNQVGWSDPSTPAAIITEASDNQPPQLVHGIIASPPVVTDSTTTLSILATDDGGENMLTYTWAVIDGPDGFALPVFTVNGSNAAKNTVVRFRNVGQYTLQCTITDEQGLTTMCLAYISVVGVTVTIPQPPQLFVATPQGADRIRLEWAAVDPLATSITLQRSTTPDFSRDVMTVGLPTTDTSFTFTELLANVPYYFRLRLSNGNEHSDWITANAKTFSLPSVPLVPTTLFPAIIENGQVLLVWGATQLVSGFILERASDPLFQENLSVYTFASLTNHFSDLKAGTGVTWYYRVRAFNSDGWSDPLSISVTV